MIQLVLACLICLAVGPIALAQSPASTDNLVGLRSASQALVQGDLKQAEDDVQLVLTHNPGDYRALNLLGIIRARQGRHADQAIAELESALKIEPGREDASKPLVQLLRGQARAALKEGQLEKSLSFLIRAKKVAANDPELVYEFGIVALRMSLFEDARIAFEQVLTSRPTDANAIYALGRAQMGLGKIAATRELFERYVNLRREDPTGHFGLGLVLRMLEKTEEARVQFERSIELQPAQTEAYVQLGFLDLDGGELEQSANRFQAALQLAPQNAGALLGTGRIQFQRKDYSKAADFLLTALAADPSIREVHYYLGLTYARLGKSKESVEQMEIASQLEREDLDRHRIILKLLDPVEAQALEKAN